MMGTPIAHQQISAFAKGLRCTTVEMFAPGSWSFIFENKLYLTVQCPWRIQRESRIAITGEDHEQQFGLPSPLDAATEAMRILSGLHIENVNILEQTGDIDFEFDHGTRMNLFNNSSGYEGWSCSTPTGLRVIGMGGGGTTCWEQLDVDTTLTSGAKEQ